MLGGGRSKKKFFFINQAKNHPYIYIKNPSLIQSKTRDAVRHNDLKLWRCVHCTVHVIVIRVISNVFLFVWCNQNKKYI